MKIRVIQVLIGKKKAVKTEKWIGDVDFDIWNMSVVAEGFDKKQFVFQLRAEGRRQRYKEMPLIEGLKCFAEEETITKTDVLLVDACVAAASSADSVIGQTMT